MHFSQMVPVSSSISFDQAKIIFMHLGLTSLAELDKVAFEDSLDAWLKDRVVDTNRRPDSLTAGSILPLSSGTASAREELLPVPLGWEVRGRLLEDDVVKRNEVRRSYSSANSFTIPAESVCSRMVALSRLDQR
jgi:hypothetical protein